MQFKEFTSRMRHATHFGHAIGDHGFVAAEVITVRWNGNSRQLFARV
jgi:hypothetical protein